LVQAKCEVEVFRRNGLSTIVNLIARTQREIYFLGITLETLRHAIHSIANALRNIRRVYVLLFDTSQPDLTAQVEQLVVTNDLGEGTNRTITALSLSDANPPLTQQQRRNLQIRIHRRLPTFSSIIIDPHCESSPYIQVEPYPFGLASEDRWVFVLSENTAGQGEVIHDYLQAYNNMWNSGMEPQL
jgi:hypothetical protein